MQGLEGHCEYCHKDGAVNASVSNMLAEVTEKAIQSMQKKIDELAQKLNEYTPQPTLQPLSPPQARVYNAMQPPTLFHSVPQASLHQVNYAVVVMAMQCRHSGLQAQCPSTSEDDSAQCSPC